MKEQTTDSGLLVIFSSQVTVENFGVGLFTVKTFRRRETSLGGVFNGRTFQRKDFPS